MNRLLNSLKEVQNRNMHKLIRTNKCKTKISFLSVKYFRKKEIKVANNK